MKNWHLFIALILILLSLQRCSKSLGTLTGTITNENDEPLSNYDVEIIINDSLRALTSKDGKYTIKKIPPGRYEVTIYISGAPEKKDSVTITANGTEQLNFTLDYPPPVMAGPSLPRSHLWDQLYEEGEEEKGYGMYTYVLVNRPSGITSKTPAWERYHSLIDAIKKSTPLADNFNDYPKEDFNLFLIPTISDSATEESADQKLNAILSSRILTGIAIQTDDQSFRQRLNNNPGPFLVSSLEPISTRESGQVDLLYLDLTSTNPAAMPEVVSAYKQRITSDEIDGVQRFHSIRLALLDLILDTDDHIKIVKTASAKWLEGE